MSERSATVNLTDQILGEIPRAILGRRDKPQREMHDAAVPNGVREVRQFDQLIETEWREFAWSDNYGAGAGG